MSIKGREEVVGEVFLWMSVGSLGFSSILVALSTYELLSADPISLHLTRTSLAVLFVMDLLCASAGWRLLHLARTKARSTSRTEIWLASIQMLMAFVCMAGYVQSKELTGGSRALLALIILVCTVSLQVRALSAAGQDDATVSDPRNETQPLLQPPVEPTQPQTQPDAQPQKSGSLVGQLVLLFVWTMVAMEAFQRGIDATIFPTPGKLVRIRDGYQVTHIACEGGSSEQHPTIVLETGLGMNAGLSWQRILKPLLDTTRVCWLDRPGYGWSESGPLPQTSSNIAEVMKLTLEGAGEKGPFVLVGHSFGGFNIRVFAKENPHIVDGLVFLDASHEDATNVTDAIDPVNKPGTKNLEFEAFAVAQGVIWGMFSPFAFIRPAVQAALEDMYGVKYNSLDYANQFNGRLQKAMTDELRFFNTLSSSQARSSKPLKPLKDLPVAVVSRAFPKSCEKTDVVTKPTGPIRPKPSPLFSLPIEGCTNGNASDTAWARCQKDLATSLSEDSKWYRTLHASHHVMLDEPEVVLEAILDVVERATNRRKRLKGGKINLGNLALPEEPQAMVVEPEEEHEL
ncbi:hypothetical protein HDU97_000051 [Phlyctochytrium planicorne]|nr:hypothetical protein HDU97_000051 [Phlyctochytrium planicorne]